MRTIFVYIALLTSFLGFSQTPFPQQEIQYSPGGKFDTIFDNYGNKFLLKDIKINTDPTATNKVVTFNDCNSGYFNLYYEDGSGFELTSGQDATLHAQRRAVLCQLFYDLSQFITPVNPNIPVNIYVRSFINNQVSVPAGVGAYASSVYLAPPITTNIGGGIIDNAIWQTINSGVDPFYPFIPPPISSSNSMSAGFYHGIIAFNFSNPTVWHQSLSPCPSTLLDLYSIGLHEITHALGFASLIDEFGQSKFGSYYPYFSRYDTYLKISNGVNLVTNIGACGSLFNYTFNPQLSTSVLSTNGTICTDPNLIQFAGSVNRKVYTNTTFDPGSSLSHFEDVCHPNNYPDNSYYVMSDGSYNTSINGQYYSKRYLKEEERKVLCDIGYKVTNTFGNHTYPNTTQCGGNQIVGVNDGITYSTSGNTYSFVVVNNSLDPIPITNFLGNDYNPNTTQLLTYECAESVYGFGTVIPIDGSTLSYLPNGTGTGIDLIRYVPILSNGQKGNITYIYIYLADANCISSLCDSYVSNGDFENSYGNGMFLYTSPTLYSTCWDKYSGSPDLWERINLSPSNNFFFPSLNIDSWNINNNYFFGLNAVKNSYIDGIQNKLITPLIPGNNYILKFKAKITESLQSTWNQSSYISVGGSSNISIPVPSYFTNFPPNISNLGSVLIEGNNWLDYQILIPSSIINQVVSYITLINSIYLSPNNQSYIEIDNIRIVEANNNVYFNPITICQGEIVDLNDFTNVPNGFFESPEVNGSIFNGTIDPGVYPVSLIFDNNGCENTLLSTVTISQYASLNITVNENSIDENDGIICSGSNATITVAGIGITDYLWSTGETTSSINVNPTSSTTYTVSVNNTCGYESVVTQLITVNPNVTTTFNQVSPICSGSTLSPLPTTSTNGKTGTWSPALSNTSTTTYTFSPTAGQCTSTATMTITVNPLTTPTFNQVSPICSGSTLSPLPTTSTNGKTGTWSPALNNTSTTTYTFTPTAGQCASTATMTITVNPLPPTFTIAPTETSGLTNNDGTICVGASATLTASVSTPTPTWSTGTTGQSITVSPLAYTTYTATITNATGCQRIVQRPINVNPLPVFSVTNTNPVICSGTSSTLTVSPSTSLTNFTWSPGTLPTTSSITVTPTTTTTYTVTAKNTTTGCTNTASTTVTVNSVNNMACCSAAQYTYNSPFNASALPNNSIIQINANMTISLNRTFTNCTFRMGPNVKIIVNTGVTLTLTNCTLFSCSEMWDGIEVLTGGSLILNGTRIEDAKEGVKSLSNASLTVENCVFNKNKTGLFLSSWSLPFTGVNNSTFECTATLNSPNGFLKAPFANEKSHYGIFLTNMENVTIGGSTTNTFQNLEIGIYAIRSTNVTIQKNNFTNINSVCPVLGACTSASLKGWCIFAYGIQKITIGNSTNSALGNTFTSSYNGIGLEYTKTFGIQNNSFSNILIPSLYGNLFQVTSNCISISKEVGSVSNNLIQKNTFQDFERGIFYSNNASNSLTVSENKFSNFNTNKKTGVHILDNPIQSFTIRNNIFNVNTNQTGGCAIIVENVNASFTTGQNLTIKANTIRNVKKGIWVTNFNSPQIIDHNSNLYSIGLAPSGTPAGIYFPSLSSGIVGNENAGIHINNCPSATISNNTIERTNYTTTAPAPLAANQYDLQFGISVGSSCTGTQVSNNVIKLMGSGIYYFGNTPISLKCNNMMNNSTGIWINGQIGQQGSFNAPQDNQWTIPTGYFGVRRIGSSQPQFFTRSFSLPYMPNTTNQMNPGFSIQPQSSSISAPNTCFISAPPPVGLVQVINEQGEYNYLSEEELKTLDVDLYKTLKITPYLYDESTIEGQRIEEFIDSVQISNSAQIYEYEEKLASKDTLEAKELMALFEAYSDVEQTYKRVYEIYNRSWLDGVHSFTAEDSLVLNEIAYLSPRIAGNAVYTARVLLGLMIIDTETYGAKSAQQNFKVMYSKLKIFPNPSSEYFHYELPLLEGDQGKVTIIDVSGKVLETWIVNFSSNKGSLNVNNYAKGIYFFELAINDNTKFVEKLIVK